MSNIQTGSRLKSLFRGFEKALLIALAYCLTLVTSGCGPSAAVSLNTPNSPNTPQTSPQLTVSASSLTFGSITVNAVSTQSLTLTSTGTSPVTLSSATISGSGFTFAQTFPVVLNPSQSITLQVQFLPTTTGALTGQLTINSDSTTGNPAMVALSGSGTTVSGQTGPQLTISTASLNFGSINVNTPATQFLTLTSIGTSSVTLSSATITGSGFTIVQTFPVVLNPSQSLTLQVQFLPATTGALTGQLTINSNSTTGTTAVVALNGIGTTGSGSQTNPQLTVSAASLNFGSVNVNTPATQPLTLASTGTSPVTVNSAAFTGTVFTTSQTFPVVLNPSQTLTFQVQFAPTTATAFSGQLTINSNSATGNPALVALSGTGTNVPTAHEVDLSWNAPASSPDPVAGYNIYRATGSGSLVLINSSPNTALTYVDKAVTSGSTYSYVVKSADPAGVESVASNQVTVTIPTP
ncbi:MAG TPA: choice-of-anchor D domain-containing protein [Edaphobacter sp.]|nr:choice-of-anchor D domain-containing protein [Edaphobacter sp.]